MDNAVLNSGVSTSISLHKMFSEYDGATRVHVATIRESRATGEGFPALPPQGKQVVPKGSEPI
ncbi:hypothetical protein G690_02529 [Escherichia coli HVH 12 (4-7653042)]|nr:hypothetical protein G690_02529 [Escherichia coli HVH 12 (4-7653042)]